MKIVRAYPPMFDEIDAVFHVRGQQVVFAWGDTIFNPMGFHLPPSLKVHEAVHMERQGADPESWWRRYLADRQFRLDEETPAHHAEYLEFCRRYGNRNRRAGALIHIARRLASDLYGAIISETEAVALVANGKLTGS